MLDRCRTASLDLSELDVLNPEQISTVLSKNESFLTSRVIVTDEAGYLIYDSNEALSVPGQIILLPEITQALRGNDVFTWNHRGGAMQSRSAAPIFSYGTLTGCVYLMDYDVSQGRLMESLQRNIYTVTIILEVLVVIYSLLTAVVFSDRIRKILQRWRKPDILSGFEMFFSGIDRENVRQPGKAGCVRGTEPENSGAEYRRQSDPKGPLLQIQS